MLVIPGVVETGLFTGMATRAYFGLANGTVAESVPLGAHQKQP